MFKTLMDDLHAYEEFKASQQEELERLQKRLAELDKTRQESVRLVAGDNANGQARQNLDETDRKIDEIKKTLSQHNRRMRTRLRSLRTRVLHTQERTLEELNLRIQNAHQEQTQIKEQRIPEAEHCLTALQDDARRLEDEIKQARKEIADINRLNLDVLSQE